MPEIFISYASADRDRARVLADALAHRGYSVCGGTVPFRRDACSTR